MAAENVIIMLGFAEMSIAKVEFSSYRNNERPKSHFSDRLLKIALSQTYLAFHIVNFHPTPSSMHPRNDNNQRTHLILKCEIVQQYLENQTCKKCRYKMAVCMVWNQTNQANPEDRRTQ